MENNDKEFIAQRIRASYVEKEVSELDELRALDASVKRPANIFGYVFGVISAIIMGSGMSLVMTDIGATLGIANAMPVGIILGCLGLGMALLTYPIYEKILASRRAKFADRIIKLSDDIIGK